MCECQKCGRALATKDLEANICSFCGMAVEEDSDYADRFLGYNVAKGEEKRKIFFPPVAKRTPLISFCAGLLEGAGLRSDDPYKLI